MENRTVVGCCLEHSYERCGLIGGEAGGSGVEIGAGGGLYTVGVIAEIYCVGIHRENLLLRINQFEFYGDYPLLAFHNENAQAGKFPEQSGGILRANAEHVFRQLLGYGRCTAGVFYSSAQAHEIYSVMTVESFVFCTYKGVPEVGRHLVIGYGRTVFLEESANENRVGTIDFGCRIGWRRLDCDEPRCLSEKPQEVYIDHAEIKEY